jgi:Asp-tRNA(Asn)/Glu-tRNA(Gln) amidotransferase A subunit family amidase
VQSDVAAAVEENVKVFEKLGHKLVRIDGGPPPLGREWAVTGSFQLASKLYAYLPEREKDIGKTLLQGLKACSHVSAEAWGKQAELRARLNDWCTQVFEQVDVLVTPTVPYDPPPAKGPFPEETEGRQQILAGVGASRFRSICHGTPRRRCASACRARACRWECRSSPAATATT